jgi:hypothetical protein
MVPFYNEQLFHKLIKKSNMHCVHDITPIGLKRKFRFRKNIGENKQMLNFP